MLVDSFVDDANWSGDDDDDDVHDGGNYGLMNLSYFYCYDGPMLRNSMGH